jgi:hypothetical protein
MDNGDTSVAVASESNDKPVKLTGFQLHPENINRTGLNRKEWTLSNALKKVIDRNPQILETIATRWIKAAAEGDQRAINDLADRLEGKPAQSLDLKGAKPFLVLDGTNNGVIEKPDEPSGQTTDGS